MPSISRDSLGRAHYRALILSWLSLALSSSSVLATSCNFSLLSLPWPVLTRSSKYRWCRLSCLADIYLPEGFCSQWEITSWKNRRDNNLRWNIRCRDPKNSSDVPWHWDFSLTASQPRILFIYLSCPASVDVLLLCQPWNLNILVTYVQSFLVSSFSSELISGWLDISKKFH